MSTSDELRKALAKAADDSARFEQAAASSRWMLDLAKAVPPPSYFAAIGKLVKSMRPPEGLTAAFQMAAAMEREHLLFTDIARPSLCLDDITKHFVEMRAVSDGITEPFRAMKEALRFQFAVFDSLSLRLATEDTAAFSMLAQTGLAWNIASVGLANRMNDIGLLAQRELLSVRLFEAPSAYTAFVQHTMDWLATDPTPQIASRLRGSLHLAEHQLVDIADTVSRFIRVPEDDDEPDDKRVLRAPFTQQDELLLPNAVEDEADVEAMTKGSPTAQAVNRSRRVLELVTLCNEAGKTSGYGIEIFKPTTRLMTVFNDLPWLSPTDRERFGDVIDCLYFIFYEGAGKDNLRFLDEHGGPLTKADCDLIWCIKHLRNKWSRHDADHGKETEIQKSWADLAAKFRWLGLAVHPTDICHFQQLHQQLLILAEDFLMRILSKLELKQ